MSAARLCALAAAVAMLSGCLEVRQEAAWVKGAFAGKRDNLPYQARFHNDKLAWAAAIQDRARNHNENLRARP